MPSTGAGTAGQHVGDRGDGVGVEALESRRWGGGMRTASPPPTAVARVRSEVPGC